MPSTHLSLHFHIVFSTKHREARIISEWRDRLHAYLGGVARNSGAIPEIVCSYIAKQEEHHRKRTFQQEYLELLHRCGVDFDERNLW